MTHTAPEQPDPSPETLTRGHEPDPLRVRVAVLFVVGFVAFAVVTHAALWYLLEAYADESREVDRPRSVARPGPQPPPGAPPLQPIPAHDRVPWQDVAAMRQSEDRVFAAMGWKLGGKRPAIPDDVVRSLTERAATRPSTQKAPASQGGGR